MSICHQACLSGEKRCDSLQQNTKPTASFYSLAGGDVGWCLAFGHCPNKCYTQGLKYQREELSKGTGWTSSSSSEGSGNTSTSSSLLKLTSESRLSESEEIWSPSDISESDSGIGWSISEAIVCKKLCCSGFWMWRIVPKINPRAGTKGPTLPWSSLKIHKLSWFNTEIPEWNWWEKASHPTTLSWHFSKWRCGMCQGFQAFGRMEFWHFLPPSLLPSQRL